jgi:hypothetical protein
MIDIYVNAKGNDSSGDGSSSNPYKTWAKAMSMVNDDCNMYFSEGVFTVKSLVDMTNSSYKMNYFGYGYSTVLELTMYYESATGSFRNQMTVSNLVIRPSNAYTSTDGSVRAISYTSDAQIVTFNYVLFAKSLNGTYPTSTVFYLHPNTNIITNKTFNYCTFISPVAQCIYNGVATYNNCTTNTSALCNVGTITNCLVNQTYDSDYKLVSNDNKIYGVWAGWLGATKMLMLVNDSRYYTISGGNVVETTFNSRNAFIASNLLTIDKSELITPFKFVIFKDINDLNNYKSIKWKINNHNSFVLFDLSTVDMDNIKLKSDHLMLVSQDLKTWDNYYDGKMQSRINIANFANEIDNLKKYINAQSKPNDFIEKKYNYMLMQLNSGENFDRICETLYADYKRFDFESDIVYGSGIEKTIKVTPTFNTDEVIVKILPKDNIINTDSLGEW